MLSGSSTSETHKGHREPCATYCRLRAERGDRWTKCDQEVSEHWHGTGGVRKCDTCLGVTREQAKIRRTTRRKAKMAARKQELENKMAAREQELENKWGCHKYRNITSAMSIEVAEAADHVNALPLLQAQGPMIHQDTVVTSEPSVPRYGERQSDEDVAWNSIADKIAWKASLHEAAQAQPKEEESEVKEEERGSKDSVETSPGFEIEHHYSPHPPHDQLCSCGAQRHKINVHRECLRRADIFKDALFFDQFTTKAFEYDPTWKAACGAVISAQEQDDVWREYLKAKEEVFEGMGGKEGGEGGEARGIFEECEGDSETVCVR